MFGSSAAMRLNGSGLESVSKIYLTELREAEYARMTYPYTMPVHFKPDPATASEQARIEGRIKSRNPLSVDAIFEIPKTARPGLWRLWAAGTSGASRPHA